MLLNAHNVNIYTHGVFLARVRNNLVHFQKCNQKTGRKFGLQEQLAVPFQRILKYPLLLRVRMCHAFLFYI